MRKLSTNPNVDNSDLTNYPDGRINNNDGSDNGTPVNERVYGDLHQTIAKLMRLYGIEANNLPDNETNGFQIVEALKALASKNDYILALSISGGFLNVPIKLLSMNDNEQVICKCGSNFGTETQIKGSDASTLNVTVEGSFKANEYVRLIKTSSGVTLVRLADNSSLDSMVAFLNYLKKATQLEENAGTIDTKATTPLTNLTAFIKRVIGTDSVNYLATALRNGLYPKEHFAIVDNLVSSKNKGSVYPLDVYATIGDISVSGDFTQATVTNGLTGHSNILVTMANAMANTDYKVNTSIESLGNINNDSDINNIVFKPLSTTQFNLHISQSSSTTQSLKLHLEVVQN